MLSVGMFVWQQYYLKCENMTNPTLCLQNFSATSESRSLVTVLLVVASLSLTHIGVVLIFFINIRIRIRISLYGYIYPFPRDRFVEDLSGQTSGQISLSSIVTQIACLYEQTDQIYQQRSIDPD